MENKNKEVIVLGGQSVTNIAISEYTRINKTKHQVSLFPPEPEVTKSLFDENGSTDYVDFTNSVLFNGYSDIFNNHKEEFFELTSINKPSFIPERKIFVSKHKTKKLTNFKSLKRKKKIVKKSKRNNRKK